MKYHQQMRTDSAYQGLRRAAIAAVAAVVAFALVPAGAVAAKPKNQYGSKNATVVVTSEDLEDDKVAAATNKKWFFYNDENDTVDNTLGSFVEGSGDAPEGEGSVQIGVSGTQRRNLATYQFAGTALEDITALKYSTYNASATNPGSLNRSGYLQFNVSFDGNNTWQRRLVHLPSQNGTVQQDTWQEWDAAADDAQWTWSGFAANGNKWPDGNTNAYRSWSDLLVAFPQIQVRDTDAFMGIRVGEPYADGYVENLDAFVFGTAAKTTTFDFEPARTPEDKKQCKQDGWRAFNEPSFKNQGECVKFVNTGVANDNDNHDHGQPKWGNAGLGGILTYLKFKFTQFFSW